MVDYKVLVNKLLTGRAAQSSLKELAHIKHHIMTTSVLNYDVYSMNCCRDFPREILQVSFQ